jgi:hypothetical protein
MHDYKTCIECLGKGGFMHEIICWHDDICKKKSDDVRNQMHGQTQMRCIHDG